jgi:hypothetical protein
MPYLGVGTVGQKTNANRPRSIARLLFDLGVGLLFVLLLALLFTTPRNWTLIIFVGIAMFFLARVGETFRRPAALSPPAPNTMPPLRPPSFPQTTAPPPLAEHPRWRRSLLRRGISVPFTAELQLSYRDGLGVKTERVVRARSLTQTPSGLYLNGFCRMRRSYRTFRADRMSQIIDQSSGEVIEGKDISNWLLHHAKAMDNNVGATQ